MEDLLQPPKAILVKGSRFKKEILNGIRNTSVRWGRIDYKEGDQVLIGSPKEGWCILKVIMKVEFKQLKDVTSEEWGIDDFKVNKDTIKNLRRFFRGISFESIVTVVTWGGTVDVW